MSDRESSKQALIKEAKSLIGSLSFMIENVEAVESLADRRDGVGFLEGYSLAIDLDVVESRTEKVGQALVALMRADGMSWQQVGECLGVSRQAAQKRFGNSEGNVDHPTP